MKPWTEGATRRSIGAALDWVTVAAAAAGGLVLSALLHGAVPALPPQPSALLGEAARLGLLVAALGCWLTATGALYLKTFRRPADAREEAARLLTGASLAALSVFAILALWPGVPLARAASDAALPALAIVTLLSVLRAAAWFGRGPGAAARTVILVDPGARWSDAVDELRAILGGPWRLVLVRTDRAATPAGEGVEVWDRTALQAWIDAPLPRRTARRTLVVLDRLVPHTDLHGLLLKKAFLNRTVITDLAELYEEVLEKAPLVETERDWFANPALARPRHIHLALKRAMDLVIAVPLFLVTLPLVGLLALAVRIEFPGSPIFTQRRIGLGGREFTLYKLRSMTVHADDSAQWPYFAASKITRLGHILRKTGLDELPQLVNVIKGDMSLVGPRPARPQVTARHIDRNPFYAVVCSVKPGISGWSQLHQGQDAGDHTMFQKARYNLYYARNYSIWLDVLICIRTFWQLVSGRKQASVYLAEVQAAEALGEGAAHPAVLRDRRAV